MSFDPAGVLLPFPQVAAGGFDIALILVQLALIIVVARVAGIAVGKVGIPPVVGEILAGVLLGPSLFGVGFTERVFPIDQRDFLSLLAAIGLVLYMFVVGLELDISLIKGRGRVAGSVSITSIMLPFGLGMGLASLLGDLRPDGVDYWPFAMFIGASMSITAFPVLARILTDRRMHRTETGGLALACAATDDVLAWTLLAVVIGIAGGGDHGRGWVVFLTVPFALFAIFVVRPALTALTGMYRRAGEMTTLVMAIVLIGLVLFAAATEYLGVHYIFGAFLFGAILPHEEAKALRHDILVRLEQLSVILLLPVFFLISGLNVNIRGLGAEHILPLVGILAVAVFGKYVGAYVGARSAGVPHWQANALGILMNTRGLTELIILNVGLSLGLLSPELFTLMVIMALATTIMTGPLLARAYPSRRVARDIAEAERLALGEEVHDRVFIVGMPHRDTLPLVDVAAALLRGRRNPEIVVATLDAQSTRRLELGSGLTDELAEMAAAMEVQQALVRRGEQRGVPVRLIANPSADVVADLLELAIAIKAMYVMAWEDDRLGRIAVIDPAECAAIVISPSVGEVMDGTPIRATWSSEPDGDAAVLAAVQIATAVGSGLDLRSAGGRRFDQVRTAMERGGVTLVEHPDELFPATVTSMAGDGAIRIRAEVDPEPVDWNQVALPTARTEGEEPQRG